MLLLFYPQKSHRRASAEAWMKYIRFDNFPVPLGPSAGVQGAKIRKTLESNSLFGKNLK